MWKPRDELTIQNNTHIPIRFLDAPDYEMCQVESTIQNQINWKTNWQKTCRTGENKRIIVFQTGKLQDSSFLEQG